MAGTLLDLAAVCGAIVVIVTAISLVAKLPPTRWLWRHLFSDPVGRWAKDIIRDGAVEFHESTVAPAIAELGVKVDELVSQGETSWHKDKAWMVSRVTRLEDRYETLRSRQMAMISGVTSALTSDDDIEGVRMQLLAAIELPEPSPPSSPGGSTLPAD